MCHWPAVFRLGPSSITMIIILLSILSALFYRCGGLAKDTKHWIPVWLRQSWVRDWLCPFCVLFPLFLHHPSPWFILAYAALGGALTTYWDWLFKFDNYWFSGFMCGVAGWVLTLAGFDYVHLVIRAIVICVLWGGWCALVKNDFKEEYGRGFILGMSSFLV